MAKTALVTGAALGKQTWSDWTRYFRISCALDEPSSL